jgi:hypothetical protein
VQRRLALLAVFLTAEPSGDQCTPLLNVAEPARSKR